jgi:uncharacterized protein
MRVMIDTNVFISALLFPSSQMSELFEKLIDEHEIVLCSHIIDELHRVFEEKFHQKKKALERFLISFPFEYFYTPQTIDASNYPNIRDKQDLPIIVSAILADVDVIITGDSDYFDIEIERPEVLKPADFISEY